VTARVGRLRGDCKLIVTVSLSAAVSCDRRLHHSLGGYTGGMTDYSEQGAVPVEDAAVADPPTVEEVAERQRVEHPDQARTSRSGSVPSDEESAAEAAGGEVVGREPGGDLDIEGPNSA
jgi:hypothetical protein